MRCVALLRGINVGKATSRPGNRAGWRWPSTTGTTDRGALGPILETDWAPEAFAIGSGVLYLWQPNGATGSPLGEALAKVKGAPVGTVRNLATIKKVLDRA